ncbi:MAG: DUF2298 domain-containing protein [Halodesulfurarchaeum sp.]
MSVGIAITWLAVFLGLGVLALPASTALFDKFADRGAGLSIPVGFAVVAFSSYWLGQVRFDRLTAVLAILGLAFLSAIALYRGVTVDRRRFREAVIVFTLAYLLLVVIRLYRPGAYPGGGEKFLDFGLLASLLRASVLPPEDMWFAGETVQYYYGGHMFAATIANLTGTAAEYAYNTALAGYYAAYVTAAWGLAGPIAARLGGSYRWGAGFAGFLVGLASNLSTPIRAILWALPESAASILSKSVGVEIAGLATGPMNFNYWLASRVLRGNVGDLDRQLITEFPFFAFLNGDLHGHMMSPVFLLLGAGLAYAYWLQPGDHRRARLGILLAIAPVGGLLIVTNTWSAASILGIAWLSLLFAPATPWSLFGPGFETMVDRVVRDRPLRTELARILAGTAIAGVLAVLTVITVSPFVVDGATTRSIGFLPTRSNLGGLLVVYGVFLGVTVTFLASRLERRWLLPLAFGTVAGLLLTLPVRATAVVLFGLPLLLGWALLRTERAGFETVLALGALGLLVLVEFVYVVEQAGPGRMNTVFKLSAQVWALWSVGAGAMAVSVFGSAGPWPALRDSYGDVRRRIRSMSSEVNDHTSPIRSSRAQKLAAVLLVITILATAIYPVMGTAWAIGNGSDSPTLDARAYVQADHPHEADAIEWLDDLEGQPNLVSAPGTDIYRWVNAPSSLTGIPTVAGWVHEVGYRGSDPYWDRVSDVEIIYETDDATSRGVLLDLYEVEYIYVGPLERERYDPPDMADEPGIAVAYSDEWVRIYRVNDRPGDTVEGS